nr:hypothetical protein [uncultured Shinella sp.]
MLNGDLTGMAEVLIRKEEADGSGFRKVPTDPAEILTEGDGFFERCAGGPPLSRPPIPLVPPSLAEGDNFLSALSMPVILARYRSLRPLFAWRMAGYCCWRSETAEDADVRARYKAAASAELQTLGALS